MDSATTASQLVSGVLMGALLALFAAIGYALYHESGKGDLNRSIGVCMLALAVFGTGAGFALFTR